MKRRINSTGIQQAVQKENHYVEECFPDSDKLVCSAELTIFINEASEGDIINVNELKEIYDLGEKVERYKSTTRVDLLEMDFSFH